MRLLMLGNGFDLHHKLPTTYLCFLKTADLIRNMSKTPENIGEVFDKLKDECKDINNSYMAYKDFYDTYAFEESDKEQLTELKTIVNDNMWFTCFCKAYNKDVGWIDFEKEISKVLLLFVNALNNLTRRANDVFQIGSDNNYAMLAYFDKMFKDPIIPNQLRFAKEFIEENKYEANRFHISSESVFLALYDDLLELANALKIYLTVFVENPLTKMKEQRSIETSPFFKPYDGVISFNYTSTYEILYDLPPLYFIHGSLDNNIILGINPGKEDELPDMDTSFIMFKKYYQRVLLRTDVSFINMINEIKKNSNQEENHLIVCGHSLDITDQDIIKEVFDVSNKIYIVCHNLKAIGNYVSNLIHIYGKKDFDVIRSKKQLQFVTYDELNELHSSLLFSEGFWNNL